MKMKNDQLIKNKIDLQFTSLMHERNAILVALAGVPLTILNLMVSVFHHDLFTSSVVFLFFLSFFYALKRRYDQRLEEKLMEIDKLMK